MASDIQFDPTDLRDFGALIDEMQRVTGRELRIVVRNAARDACRAAIKFTPIAPRTITGRTVRGRGFARAGWLKSLRGLGVQVRAQYDQGGGKLAGQFSEFTDGLGRDEPSVEMANQVPYIEELEGSILPKTISETNRRMAVYLTRQSRRMAGAWGR